MHCGIHKFCAHLRRASHEVILTPSAECTRALVLDPILRYMDGAARAHGADLSSCSSVQGILPRAREQSQMPRCRAISTWRAMIKAALWGNSRPADR
eukprot:scaffold32936_cov129-Isochrysis_galbana.AAC.2